MVVDAYDFRCRSCDHRVEYDEYEEAWFHTYNGHYTCGEDLLSPEAIPALIIEELPG